MGNCNNSEGTYREQLDAALGDAAQDSQGAKKQAKSLGRSAGHSTERQNRCETTALNQGQFQRSTWTYLDRLETQFIAEECDMHQVFEGDRQQSILIHTLDQIAGDDLRKNRESETDKLTLAKICSTCSTTLRSRMMKKLTMGCSNSWPALID